MDVNAPVRRWSTMSLELAHAISCSAGRPRLRENGEHDKRGGRRDGPHGNPEHLEPWRKLVLKEDKHAEKPIRIILGKRDRLESHSEREYGDSGSRGGGWRRMCEYDA